MTREAEREEFEKWARDHPAIGVGIEGDRGRHIPAESVEALCREAFQAGERLGRERAIGDCIERVMNGRTIHNFGHVPEIVRALEWVWADLQELQDSARAETENKS